MTDMLGIASKNIKVFWFFSSEKNVLPFGRIFRLVAGGVVLLGGCTAGAAPCLLAGQTRMEIVELYFGRNIAGHGDVSDTEWNDFVVRDLTAAFPSGFTVFDARGQWLDPHTGSIGQEPTRVVRVAIIPTSDLPARIDAVVESYKKRFQQAAVGAVTEDACARF